MNGRIAIPIGWFGLCALMGALVCGQAPNYYSNQHQYLLHGLAQAGVGQLEEDWLANTTDPTPLFSLLVATTARLADPLLFHVYYALLIGLYFVGLVEIAVLSHQVEQPWAFRLVVLALLLFVHSALIRWASYRLIGHDYPWYLQAGVAGQYVLGPVFQPSTFGVLLLASLWLFLANRPGLAMTSAAVGAALHSTYLLHAGILGLGFWLVLLREGRKREVWQVAALAAGLLLPTAGFMLWTFRPSSAEEFSEAQHVLAHFRIPHHCLPQLWCDAIAIGQIALCAAGVLLLHRTRLFIVLVIALLLAAVLTLLQVCTGSDSLALLFPWRVSAVLVPVATAVCIGQFVLWSNRSSRLTIGGGVGNRLTLAVCIALLLVLCTAGAIIMATRQAYQSSPEEEALLRFVRDTAQPGDVYLLPVQVPNLKAATKGSLSSDFKPAAAKQQDARLIPIDLQRFRLSTGAALYVDFKSIPYRDTDVLEWQQRIHWTEDLYKRLRSGQAVDTLLRERGITHLILREAETAPGGQLAEVYRDSLYRMMRLHEVRLGD